MKIELLGMKDGTIEEMLGDIEASLDSLGFSPAPTMTDVFSHIDERTQNRLYSLLNK